MKISTVSLANLNEIKLTYVSSRSNAPLLLII